MFWSKLEKIDSFMSEVRDFCVLCFVLCFVLCLLTAIGPGIIYLGVTQGLRIEQVKSWPTTTGVFLLPEISDDTARIPYEYVVAGTTYRNYYSRAVANNAPIIPDHLQSGARVIVYYDANKPSDSLIELEHESHWLTVFIIGFGTICTLLCALALCGYSQKAMTLFDWLKKAFTRTAMGVKVQRTERKSGRSR